MSSLTRASFLSKWSTRTNGSPSLSPRQMRLTAIDIGTNTILMLIADLGPDGSFSVVRDEQVIARLGKGVDAQRRVTSETTERVVRFLSDFLDIARPLHPDRII